MRKLFIVLLMLGLLLAPVGSLYADRNISPVSTAFEMKSYVYVKSAGAIGIQTVPLTSAGIEKKDYIIGWSLQATDTGKGAVAGLYDTTATAVLLTTALFDEAEVDTNQESKRVWYPFPKKLSNQLQILAGTAGCVITIFYVDG